MTQPPSNITAQNLDFLRQLLRDLTHEIAAPLTPLFGHLDLLELRTETDLTPMQERCIAAMRRSLRRLSAINDCILELARLERGHIPCEPLPITPQTVIAEVSRRCHKDALSKDVQLLADGDHSEEVRILADWNLLVIAMGHLVDNALRSSPPKGVVMLRAQCTDHECALIVEDQGPAVTQTELSNLLRPFYRIHDKEGYTETAGLGLTIVDLIARRQGARLDLSIVNPEDQERPGLRASLVLSRME